MSVYIPYTNYVAVYVYMLLGNNFSFTNYYYYYNKLTGKNNQIFWKSLTSWLCMNVL